MKYKTAKHIAIVLILVAVLSFSLFIFFAQKCYDVKNNYFNAEEYPTLSENAYVGGDAYNYIINAGYFTGYAILSGNLLIVSTILICTAFILLKKSERNNEDNSEDILVAFSKSDTARVELPKL